MKRTLGVMLVVVCLMTAFVRMRYGIPEPMLAMREARAAEERVRALSDTLPPVSLSGEQGGVGTVSPVELPTVEPTRREAPPVLPGNNVAPDAVGDDRPAALPTNDAVVGGADELKVFRLQNADASETLRAIQPLLPPDAKVSADQRTNSLIVSANADRLLIITALLIALDEAPGKKRLPLPGQPDPKTGHVPSNPSTTNWPVAAGLKNDQDVAMDREAKQLAVRVRAAKEPEKSKLRAELELLTDKHFELRQQRRATEIAELADRVDKLRVAHHRRQENKPDILKRRLADLLDEENELKWDESRGKPTPIVPSLSRPQPEPQLPNLDGEWLVTLPAGFEFVGTIEKRPEGCWSFQEMRNMSGYYQLEGNTLKAVVTDKKEHREYEWLILNDNVMVLTKSPPQEKVGSDYRGATLRRGVKPKKLGEKLPTRLDSEGINQILWSRVGFKLAPMELNDKIPENAPSYRGGMRVIEVREESPAAAIGIRQGDILVGLDSWETTSFENVKYIFEHADVPSIKITAIHGSSGKKASGMVPWTYPKKSHSEESVEGVPAKFSP